MSLSLNVFTLNCWGIPAISKNRKERIKAIVEYLCESKHNIVCLQEIWSEGDFIFLRDHLKDVLSYSHYFYSGVLGSGLCVFSKWPIQDVFFHQWPLNGYIHKIHHGDWFGGKGVGLCRIKYNDRIINVYCTHLHAEYHEDDMYLAHRVLQAHSTAEFVKLTRDVADISILAGDFNAAPGELSYRLLTEVPSLVDPYDLDYKCEDSTVTRATGTCDNANNSYTNPKLAEKNPEGKRVDHILFDLNPAWEAHIENFGNPLKERVPGKTFSYSDHNAVCLQLRLEPSKGDVSTKLFKDNVSNVLVKNKPFPHHAIEEAINVCEEARIIIIRAKKIYLTTGAVILMFLLGSISFWNNHLLYDIVKIGFTGLCFYNIMMGTLWNQIEMNSLKAGLSALAYSKITQEINQKNNFCT